MTPNARAVLEARGIQSAAMRRLKGRVADLEAAIRPFAESPESCADKQCHRELCGPEECARCSRAIAAWRALYPGHEA